MENSQQAEIELHSVPCETKESLPHYHGHGFAGRLDDPHHSADPTSVSSVPAQVKQDLTDIRDILVEGTWLREKLQALRRQLDRKYERLDRLTWDQTPGERDFQKRLAAFVPEDDAQTKLVQNYRLAELALEKAQKRFERIDWDMKHATWGLSRRMLEIYGAQIPSEEEIRVRFDAYTGYDMLSDAESVENAVLDIQSNMGDRNIYNIPHPNSDDRQEQRQEDARLSTVDESTQKSMFVDFGHNDPEYQERLAQWNAKNDRRQARNEMFRLQAEFDHFFCSFEEYKRTFRMQIDHVDGTDSLTVFAREWFEAGHNVTQRLRWCEERYRFAALKAKEMKVMDLSENQSSLFPSDDGVDMEQYNEELLKAQDRMDRDRIFRWIKDDQVTDGQRSFERPEAPPSEDASHVLRDAGIAALEEIGFGRDEEFQATGRRRAHIDEWDQLRAAAYRKMLDHWHEMKNERWDVPDAQPAFPTSDLVGQVLFSD
jgi:hypothetical protein